MIDSNVYTENSIRTYTGKVFDLKILDPESICIEDIAHALSNTARFGGHLDKMYSVAQHCWYMANDISPENKLGALLHDASEAYMGDMPSPFKKLLPDFKLYEDRLMAVISEKYGFDYPLNREIKQLDRDYLSFEWNSFVLKKHPLEYWEPKFAEEKFLDMFYTLNKKC